MGPDLETVLVKIFPLVATLALNAAPIRAQTPPPSAPAPTTTANKTPAKKKAAGGKAPASTETGPDLDDASRREIQCPRGFVPEKTGGPHLTVMQKKKDLPAARHRKKGSPGYSDDEEVVPTRKTMARRCVPAASLEKKKPAAAAPKKEEPPSETDEGPLLRPAN